MQSFPTAFGNGHGRMHANISPLGPCRSGVRSCLLEGGQCRDWFMSAPEVVGSRPIIDQGPKLSPTACNTRP
jgi:hypothetical protein